jgi:hypothetical protein
VGRPLFHALEYLGLWECCTRLSMVIAWEYPLNSCYNMVGMPVTLDGPSC